eukprot:scaffold246347_cov47-Attheya_sp.AAC.1
MDMRVFNIRGNTDQSEFDTFCKGVIDLLEVDGTGAHDRHHIDVTTEELGGAATYMSCFISLEDIIRETCAYLDDNGWYYKVPSSCMLAYQFSPNHEHCKMATTINLVEEAKYDTQPVSHMLPWNAAIYAVGLDDKAGIPVGQKVALSGATQRQSGRTIVSERYETVAGDHDFKCDKVVASVIHRLNIAKDVEESKYSGGPEGNDTVAVALHDSTLEPSYIFTHNECVLNDMEALAIAEMNRYTFENMSDTDDQEDQIKHSYLDFMPYILFTQTDGGPDHNIILMRCRLAAVAVFLLGNMDRVIMVRGCPQLSI